MVMVLGDVGRSPRMQYHTESLLGSYKVDLIGYKGTLAISSLLKAEKDKRLNIHYLDNPKKLKGSRMTYLFNAILRIIHQVRTILTICLKCNSPDVILIQTPPAIPTILIAYFISLIQGTRLIIDWHNTSSSILATKLSSSNPAVQIVALYERIMAKLGDFAGNVVHLCVCEGFKQMMKSVWKVKADIVVLYDRPPDRFKKLSEVEQVEFLSRFTLPNANTNEIQEVDLVKAGKINPDRNLLLLSSTSWTEDEDFSMLLSSLQHYDRNATKHHPNISCFITGRGPLLSHYIEKMKNLHFKKVIIRTIWLEPEDYPLLLGSVDLGISLHTSSSGLDLPMKIVDMFGSGLPVIALDYPVLHSEMIHSKNGFVVKNDVEMGNVLLELLKGWKYGNESELMKLSRNVQDEFTSKRWNQEWNEKMKSILS